MHFEVDVVVQHPLDEQASRFLSTVQKSANRVVRFRGDDHRIVVTVEAHAYDRAGAVRAARPWAIEQSGRSSREGRVGGVGRCE